MKKPHKFKKDFRFEIIKRKINLKSLEIQRCNEYICESKYRFSILESIENTFRNFLFSLYFFSSLQSRKNYHNKKILNSSSHFENWKIKKVFYSNSIENLHRHKKLQLMLSHDEEKSFFSLYKMHKFYLFILIFLLCLSLFVTLAKCI